MRSQSQSSLHIQDDILNEVSEAKGLGIIVDDILNSDSYCISKVKQASKIINVVFPTFETMATLFLFQLYKTYVLPILDYGCSVHSPYIIKNIKFLESVQRQNSTQKEFPNFSTLIFLIDRSFKPPVQISLRRLIFDLYRTYKLIYGCKELDFRDFLMFQ